MVNWTVERTENNGGRGGVVAQVCVPGRNPASMRGDVQVRDCARERENRRELETGTKMEFRRDGVTAGERDSEEMGVERISLERARRFCDALTG